MRRRKRERRGGKRREGKKRRGKGGKRDEGGGEWRGRKGMGEAERKGEKESKFPIRAAKLSQ